jgi:hypothetical protein
MKLNGSFNLGELQPDSNVEKAGEALRAGLKCVGN